MHLKNLRIAPDDELRDLWKGTEQPLCLSEPKCNVFQWQNVTKIWFLIQSKQGCSRISTNNLPASPVRFTKTAQLVNCWKRWIFPKMQQSYREESSQLPGFMAINLIRKHEPCKYFVCQIFHLWAVISLHKPHWSTPGFLKGHKFWVLSKTLNFSKLQ